MASHIGLNVGGKIYQTSMSTMERYPQSYFAKLVDGRVPSTKDEHGNYHIDRDGEIFRHVLNYARMGKLVLPDGFNELELVECEADFFQLADLKEDIQGLRRALLDDEGLCLNVSGNIHLTTRDVLAREPQSFFKKILDHEMAPVNGKYFIPAPGDGDLFSHILHFLEHGTVDIPMSFTDEQCVMLEEQTKYLHLEVLQAHMKVLRMLRAHKSSLRPWQSATVVGMFAGQDRVVLYSSRAGVFDDLSKSGGCDFSWRKTTTTWALVHVATFTLDKSNGDDHASGFHVSTRKLVEALFKTVGKKVHEKDYGKTRFAVFGSNEDRANEHLQKVELIP